MPYLKKIFIACLISNLWSVNLCAYSGITVTLHIRGTYETKISLLPLFGSYALKPIIEVPGIKAGNKTTVNITAEDLPGEFVLRFDYKENENSQPYPSEKKIFIYNQDLELWVNPMYCNNPDSTYFQKDETENRIFSSFSKENNKRMEKLSLLHGLLMGYDDIQSKLYNDAIEEYEKRRTDYNNWLSGQLRVYKGNFVSNVFKFHFMPAINWKGGERDRRQSLIEQYFNGIDFNDSLLIRTSGIKEWMNNYVNLYGESVTSISLRDSLFSLAGKTAIEKASKGHSLVYGWMVDYFYNGFESFNMEAGIKMLQPYLDDPLCLTNKRQAIKKRLQGMEKLVPGTIAPDFIFHDITGYSVLFHEYKTTCDYKLILFWSAACDHCKELVKQLYPWQQVPVNNRKLDILALSVDESKMEIEEWKKEIKLLNGWKHSLCAGGVNSPEAVAFYILSTPVMILVEAKTNKIISIPQNIGELINALR